MVYDKLALKVSELGFYTKIDLGIVKKHFELDEGRETEIGA